MIKEQVQVQVQVQEQPETTVEVIELPIVETEFERRMRLWLEALESGRYHQTTGVLRRDNAYCCLGVANEVVFNAAWEASPRTGHWCTNHWVDDRGCDTTLHAERYEALNLHLTPTEEDVRKARRAGLPTSNWEPEGAYPAVNRGAVLVTLNDDYGVSFKTITALIRVCGWDKEPVVDRSAPVG